MYLTYQTLLSKHDKYTLELYSSFIRQLSEISKADPFMLGFTNYEGYSYNSFAVHEKYSTATEVAFRTVFPNSELMISNDHSRTDVLKERAVIFKDNSIIPLKIYDDLDQPDPINILLENFAQLSTHIDMIKFEVWLKPVSDKRPEQLTILINNFPASFARPETRVFVENKKKQKLYHCSIRFIHSEVVEEKDPEQVTNSCLIFLKQFSLKYGNSLDLDDQIKMADTNIPKLDNLLGLNEVLSLIHLPREIDANRKIAICTEKILPVPREVIEVSKNDDVTLFGHGSGSAEKEPIGILPKDRTHHTYIIGKTGSGKTKLLELLMKDDIEKGRGMILIDPHGDTAKDILALIPKSRVSDTVYIDFPNRSFIHTFNPLSELERSSPVVIDNFIEIFKKFFSVDWNPKIEFLLRNLLGLMRESGIIHLSHIPMILTNSQYRSSLVEKVNDRSVENFWKLEYPKFSEQYFSNAVSPLLNKINQILTNPILEKILSIGSSSFDLRKILQEQQILIVNLSIAELGETGSSFLGSMLISSIQQIAMSNNDLKEDKRVPINLYVDEFQHFSTESFIRIFSEARKYRLSLTIAHQYIGQISTPIMNAIMGNIGSIISFRLGQRDANYISKEFKPYLSPEDFVQLNSRNFWAKLSVDGTTSQPFRGISNTLEFPTVNYVREIKSVAKSKYSFLESEVNKAIDNLGTIDLRDINTFDSPV
ncbi:type IV secretion system DNA-binding domain-containing protein [Candidatus Nomurabacteria bacterium]|uniref:Type IV secretion system DNA-binding domain-containing protein n=1 Tax=Candidatus Dojkabacteria bacterium TaxID=2099670 RepID=A0A955I2A5_9BACT|nr:type IV secretion system DNA-binding domain-containing protein [Candidatus Dojkabacteria bacterium]MCB9790025.1 type IV secretion system DNA-binding domain-containing protein [Candidatus Nomurabacteria bacterium]MCB9803388.1 type IV secretion system DNA-binding domain-containing protein [Candidatus Nomurabacteria bacterium]